MFDSDLGAIAKRLCPGLQIRLDQFDSGSRLQKFIADTVFKRPFGAFFFFCITDRCSSLVPCLRSGLDLAGSSSSLPIQCHGVLHAFCIDSMAACLFWSFIADLVNLIVSICFNEQSSLKFGIAYPLRNCKKLQMGCHCR